MKKLLLVCALLAAGPALAQTTPPITFGATVTNANGTLNTTLNWNAPGATGCTASGHASWSGAKAASGSQALPAITMSGSYTLTLACSFPGDARAVVSWTRPTTNTDGSALAQCPTPVPTSGECLAGFRVLKSTAANMQSPEAVPVNVPSAQTYTWNNIDPAGTYYFAVEAVNANGVASELSNVASKVITSATTRNASVTLTVNPKPSAPVMTIE